MTIQTDISSSLAASSKSLNNLRVQAKQEPVKALKAAAQQFETVFMNMMLKSMRDATPKDGMFDSNQTKMFTGMLDQQLAQNMSRKGIGLADVMIKQLSKNLGSAAMPSAPVMPAWSPASLPSSDAIAKKPSNIASTSLQGVPSAYNENFQQGFVQTLTPHVLRASKETGVPASLMMSQAALESGWGRHEIRMTDGSKSHNLFGIKATGSWHGKVAEITTTEYKNGVAHKEVAKFRAYDSYTDAFKDYAHLISNNPRYAEVMKPGQSGSAAAHAIQDAGYATDPKYADKLVRIMNQINSMGG